MDSVKKRFIYSVILIMVFMGSLFASGDMELVLPDLSGQDRQRLLAGEMLEATTLDQGIVHLMPVETALHREAERAESAGNSFTIATLSFIPYPASYQGKTTAERQLLLFNTMRRISTQKGITYISHRAGNKPRVLFEDSSYISDPKRRNSRIPDPVVTSVPAEQTDYAYQKDSSFGGNVYQHTYTNSDREIFLEVKNLTSMKVFGLFTAVPVEQLTMNIGTYQLDDGVLVVALATVEDKPPQVSVLGYTVDLPSSFLKRITSLQEWYTAQMNAQ